METNIPKSPLTSWVIRTKNEEKWLEKVLKRLFSQSRLDFEVIIVDSGSTDKTLDIVKNFPIQKVISIASKDFNYSYALNLGIKEARGKYIGIISGHSLPVSNTWYQKALINFDDPKVAAVSGYYTALPDGSFDEKFGDLQTYFRQIFERKKSKKAFNSNNMTNTNAIIRKDLWKIYPFDETLLKGCEDYDWAKEMAVRGYKIVTDPAFNVYHSHGGIGKPTYREMLPEWQRICALVDKRKRPRESYTKLSI